MVRALCISTTASDTLHHPATRTVLLKFPTAGQLERLQGRATLCKLCIHLQRARPLADLDVLTCACGGGCGGGAAGAAHSRASSCPAALLPAPPCCAAREAAAVRSPLPFASNVPVLWPAPLTWAPMLRSRTAGASLAGALLIEACSPPTKQPPLAASPSWNARMLSVGSPRRSSTAGPSLAGALPAVAASPPTQRLPLAARPSKRMRPPSAGSQGTAPPIAGCPARLLLGSLPATTLCRCEANHCSGLGPRLIGWPATCASGEETRVSLEGVV